MTYKYRITRDSDFSVFDTMDSAVSYITDEVETYLNQQTDIERYHIRELNYVLKKINGQIMQATKIRNVTDLDDPSYTESTVFQIAHPKIPEAYHISGTTALKEKLEEIKVDYKNWILSNKWIERYELKTVTDSDGNTSEVTVDVSYFKGYEY